MNFYVSRSRSLDRSTLDELLKCGYCVSPVEHVRTHADAPQSVSIWNIGVAIIIIIPATWMYRVNFGGNSRATFNSYRYRQQNRPISGLCRGYSVFQELFIRPHGRREWSGNKVKNVYIHIHNWMMGAEERKKSVVGGRADGGWW